MYPTAAKLVASVSFAALSWYASRLVVPNLPDGMSEGRMPECNALVGLVLGWRLAGRQVGTGWASAMGIGVTTGAAIVACALLVWAGHETLMRSLNVRYDGPMAALEDMIAIAIRHATFLWPGSALPILAAGSALIGVLAEATTRRAAPPPPPPMTRLFLFGTLLDTDLRHLVAGVSLRGRPAALKDHVVRCAAGADFPVLVARPGEVAEGIVFDIDADALARLDFYEAGFGFQPQAVKVLIAGNASDALVYRPLADVAASDGHWSLSDWQADWADVTIQAARESMEYFGAIDGAELRSRVPTIFIRAASTLRAGRTPMPTDLRTSTRREAIDVVAARRPYTHYFTVSETDLRHPTFSGSMSNTVTRGAFVMGDAVTVLPYDPVRDRVMVVEQFRFGPFTRGAPHPWCLEPIAGRIDPGEDPETAARREAVEEANLKMRDLLFIGSHYPSPGAVTEYLYCYVGLTDLPDAAAGLGGQDAEDEDIRAHVIPFDRLIGMMESGEIDTGPLHLSALWLDRARARGRFA